MRISFKRNGFIALASMLSFAVYAGDNLPLATAASGTNGSIQVSEHGVDTSNEIQQARVIQGTVLEEGTNEPLIGVNVVVKGTTNGTITDIDGNFSLEVPDNAILVVSYIGYTDRTVEVGNSSKVMVSLSEDTQKLDEVVVVGYGTQKKVNLTGAISSLDAETLRVAMDALESLRTQGRKIGVISHVQEMTERIPVQIRVNRAGNGRSYLEVI